MKKTSVLAVTLLCCHGYTHLYKNWMTEWLLLYLSICSINSSACLTASPSLWLSVSSQLPQYVCHYCLSVSLQCSHVCQPVCLSSSLSLCQAYIHKLPWLSELHSAILLKDDQRELFYEDTRTVVCRWARMQVTAQTEVWQEDTV